MAEPVMVGTVVSKSRPYRAVKLPRRSTRATTNDTPLVGRAGKFISAATLAMVAAPVRVASPTQGRRHDV